MTTDPCPRCQLAGPHRFEIECIGALLAWCRLLESEVADLRSRVVGESLWVVYHCTHDGEQDHRICRSLEGAQLQGSRAAGGWLLCWEQTGPDTYVSGWGKDNDWRIERWEVLP